MSKIWHLRLGHSSDYVLKHIPLLKSLAKSCNKDCPVCPIAKQCKLPFNDSNSYASTVFELLHLDVWGPYHMASTHGCKFFLTIVDDHSRATWVFLMSTKQQVYTIFKKFLTYIDNHYHKSVKTIRTDNGSEFINQAFHALLTSLGITHQTSCPYTPQQNARVERKHRHLLEMARALRFQAGLPLKYWGECVLTSTYLINRLPTPILHNKSPYEVLHGTLPDYSLLRAFGCLCFASVHTNDKFASRAIKSVFLGYPSNKKGYALLNLETHTIFDSRNVVFHENIFPYHLKNDTNTSSGVQYSFMDWYNSNDSSPFVNTKVSFDPKVLSHDDFTQASDHSSPVINAPGTPLSFHNDFDGDPSPPREFSAPLNTTSTVENSSPVECRSSPVENNVPVEPVNTQPVRHSNRSGVRPQWWNDYHIPIKSSKAHFCNFMDAVTQHNPHQGFLGNSTSVIEPAHYFQATT